MMDLNKLRTNWGWFGKPWPSGICYDDDDRLKTEMNKEFPTGESCIFCEQMFDEEAGDSGQAMPSADGHVDHIHKECLFLCVAGPMRLGIQVLMLSKREAALEVWRLIVGPHGT
jgi:hypothetical protein